MVLQNHSWSALFCFLASFCDTITSFLEDPYYSKILKHHLGMIFVSSYFSKQLTNKPFGELFTFKRNIILKFLLLHKFLLERKHLQFIAKLFAVLIAALSRNINHQEMYHCITWSYRNWKWQPYISLFLSFWKKYFVS